MRFPALIFATNQAMWSPEELVEYLSNYVMSYPLMGPTALSKPFF